MKSYRQKQAVPTWGGTGSPLLCGAGAPHRPSQADSWREPWGPRWTCFDAPWPGRRCQIYPSLRGGQCQSFPDSIFVCRSRKGAVKNEAAAQEICRFVWNATDVLRRGGHLTIIHGKFVWEKDRQYFRFQPLQPQGCQRWQCTRRTLRRFLRCRFWCLFSRLRVHLGDVRLGMGFSRIMFGLQGRISFPSSGINILISVVCGFNSRHMSHWLLMAGRPLNALRSIWQTEDPLVRSWCDRALLCLLWHRNTFGPISISLQMHGEIKYWLFHPSVYQPEKLCC